MFDIQFTWHLDSANKHQNLILFVSFPNNTLWIIGADMIKGATVRTLSEKIGPSVLRAPAEQTKVATIFGN